jgi:hypothetical protein
MESFYGKDKLVLYAGYGSNPFGMDTHLDDTWVLDNSYFPDSGTFISEPYNIKHNSSFTMVSWNALTTPNSNIKLQLRTAGSKPSLNLKDFLGPDGTVNSYYTNSPTVIWITDELYKWIQYKVYFGTNNKIDNPELFDVSIWYNFWPDSVLTSPANNSILNNNIPIFQWDFIDSDSIQQTEFQVQIADDIKFENVVYDSQPQMSIESSWQFPSGTSYDLMTDGSWYWRVKVKDNDGSWSDYSTSFKLTIDTHEPMSMVKIPMNNGFYNDLNSISGTASDPFLGTGINNVQVEIKDLKTNKYWDGASWIDKEIWITAVGTDDWELDTSSIPWISGRQYLISPVASDLADNVETIGMGNMFTFDSGEVKFSNHFPLDNETSMDEYLEIGIKITDSISLVNGSSIEYSKSTDEGVNWVSWTSLDGYENHTTINVKLNLTFPNGTANRIKWRAGDIAGNGLTESDVYIVNINTWNKNNPPKLYLQHPENESVIARKSVELTWKLLNPARGSVEYDVLFDTVNPPISLVEENFTETSLEIDGLEDGTTYYWTVIPKIGIIEGKCLSGIWSFSIDLTSLPRVILLKPLHEATINTTEPTLSWALDYNVNQTVTYDIHLDTKNPPDLLIEDHPTNEFTNNILENYQIYYWKIVPRVGDKEGKESDIWSFRVEGPGKPNLDFILTIEPAIVDLKPGENKTVIATVTNLGSIKDSISLNTELLEPIDGSKVAAVITKPTSKELDPLEDAEFIIIIKVHTDAQKGIVIFNLTAISEQAPNYGLEVKKNLSISVEVLEVNGLDGKSTDKKDDQSQVLWIIGIVIIIIIMLILFLFIKKKKKSDPNSQDELKESKENPIDPKPPQQSISTPPQAPLQTPQMPPQMPMYTHTPMQMPLQMPLQMQPQMQPQIPFQSFPMPAIPIQPKNDAQQTIQDKSATQNVDGEKSNDTN